MTATDLANLALSHLGAITISDIAAPTNKEGRAMALHWPRARAEALQSRRWTCAIKREDLALSGDQPLQIDGFSKAFDLPCDCLRILEINGTDSTRWEGSFLIESRAILTNEETVRLRFIFDNTDLDTWDPLLIDAVALLLAAKAARSLTGSEAVEQTLRQQYERLAVPKASLADGQQEGSGENSPLLRLISQSAGSRFRGASPDLHGLYRDRWPQ